MAINGDGQLGIDERVVEDDELSKLLDRRLRAADDKAEITKAYKAIDAEARDRIAALELADGDAIRVGRFRITRSSVPPRSVSFETAPTSRLSIELWA